MDKPILFNKDMVLATITCAKCGKISVPFPCEHCGSEDFLKTNTRRIMKPQPKLIKHEDEGGHVEWSCAKWPNLQVDDISDLVHYAKYQVGDRLYVRESFWQKGYWETDDNFAELPESNQIEIIGSKHDHLLKKE